MADENNTPQVENAQGAARRTLKLRPAATNPAGSQLADPMHGDTDTSNLDVLDDTQTRKTIKIKPLNPTAPQINISSLPQTPGATPLTGTQTRKTVVLKGQASGAGATPLTGTQTRKAVVLSPGAGATPLTGTQTRKAVVLSPGAGATPLTGTQTRKTVVLKPAAKPSVPVAAPAPEAAEKPAEEAPAAVPAADLDDTVTRKATVVEAPAAAPVVDLDDTVTRKATVVEAPAAAPAADADDTMTRKATVMAVPEIEEEKTVKITRPKFVKPAPVDPKRTVKLDTVAAPVPPVPAPAAAPVKEVEPEPAAEPEQITPAVPEPPVPAPAIPEPPVLKHTAAQSELTEILPETAVEDAESGSQGIPVPPPVYSASEQYGMELDSAVSAEKPSVLYLVLAAVSLLLLIACAAFTAPQYLDFNHEVDIYQFIPGLPQAGK